MLTIIEVQERQVNAHGDTELVGCIVRDETGLCFWVDYPPAGTTVTGAPWVLVW